LRAVPSVDLTRFVHSGGDDLIEKELITEWVDPELRGETVLCLPMVSPREPRVTAVGTRRRTQKFFMAPLRVSTDQLSR
jgi:hypothetical protein